LLLARPTQSFAGESAVKTLEVGVGVLVGVRVGAPVGVLVGVFVGALVGVLVGVRVGVGVGVGAEPVHSVNLKLPMRVRQLKLLVVE